MDKAIMIADSTDVLNLNSNYLDNGWRVKHISPQNVSTGSTAHLYGNFLVIISDISNDTILP